MAIRKTLDTLLSDWPAKILSLAAAVLLFFFQSVNRLEERPLSVPLSIIANDDFVPASAYPRTVRLVLRGESNAIYAILESDLEASVDYSAFEAGGVYRAPVLVAKRGSALGIDPLEIRVEPADVAVQLERRARKAVPVAPSFRGFLDPGYELASYSIEPRTVEVSGPESLVERTVDVATEYVELTGRSQDFTTRVRLARRDSLIELSGPETVEFVAVVRRATVTRSFEDLPIAVSGLDAGFSLGAELPTGTLRIAGSRELVEAFAPAPDALSLDLSGVTEPGIYALPVLVRLGEGVVAESWSPENITVRIDRATGEAGR